MFNKRARRRPQKLKIEEKQIDWVPEVKYLGVTLHFKLQLSTHLKEQRRKWGSIVTLLYPLLCRDSKPSKENKIKIVKSLVIPTIIYAI